MFELRRGRRSWMDAARRHCAPLRGQLEYDPEKMRITNNVEANKLLKPTFRKGWDFHTSSRRPLPQSVYKSSPPGRKDAEN